MTLLLLGGAGEARKLAEALAGKDAVLSLAGATRSPATMPIKTRVGGFGGRSGFCAFLKEAGIDAVLDATHPFAHRITTRTVEICADVGLPYLQFLRPAWTPDPGDNWTFIPTEDAAAEHIAKDATVFLGTGRQTLERFANLAPRRVICRQIDPPSGPFPFAGGEFLLGRPPFSVEAEEKLFSQLGVDVLVVKNAGGAASATKLTAARRLGIPVLMLMRPETGNWPVVETMEEALSWAMDHCKSA